MAQVLLLLPLLFLSPTIALCDDADPGPGASERLRALLAELAGPILTQKRGVPCQDLGPKALPGFSRLPPEPHALARAALALALNGAGCAAEAEAEALGLAGELGTPTAMALLRGLARLREGPAPQPLSLLLLSLAEAEALGLAGELGTPTAMALLRGLARLREGPAPQPLSLLLLSLARPGGSACVDPTRLGTPVPGTQPVAPSLGRVPRAWLSLCRRLSRRRREGEGEAEDACNPPGEQEAHRVLEWVPGVSIFYNLGTSVYFAFQGCSATASARALEATEDLGYAGLAALTGGLGGPVAMGVQLGLQPGLKAGVRALIGYFTSAGDPPPVPTAHSGSAIII
ncbi:apolipoprotein F [Empidonax traillii]|uniref:apolipoprotein F n=1 Tax=Empidonax traillii TaxID=164674 RepID=UPI000FFCF19F|nr:apolipoprotein F [Empidonax traillii]